MRVKRYVVDSMPDAMQQIRTELGKDAVILNTKEIRSGGFLGLFVKRKIEVIAATDSATPAAPAAAVRGGTSSAAALGLGVLAKGAQPSAPVFSPPVPKEMYKSPSPIAVIEESPLPPPSREHFVEKPRPSDDLLLEEIRKMKEMVASLTKINGMHIEPENALTAWKEKLLGQEFIPELVDKFIEEAKQSPDYREDLDERTAYRLVREQLERLLGSDAPRGIAPDTRIAHFVGPTGVGKTTTIAKIAAEQSLKFNRKIGFITSDTYRIAAVEQLKTYATILNIPLEVVFSPQDIAKAFERLQECDMILMDTAGRNYRNEMYVSELNSLLKSRGKSETYLVLNLTMKYKDMRAITENFSKFHLDKVLFTKMDETESIGSMFNLMHEFPLKLSYVTIGQNVPDDIEEAVGRKIIDRTMGECPHE